MKILLIAAVLGCAFASSASGDIVAGADESSLRLEEVPQNVVTQQIPIVAEPLNEETSPQLQKILSTIPELIHEAADGRWKGAEGVEGDNRSAEVVGLPQDGAVQSGREGRQLIGFIPSYMLRPAIRFVQVEEEDDDGDVEEERAIRRRKVIRRRNIRGQRNKQQRRKSANKRSQMKRRKLNNKRKTQKRRNSMQKKKMQRMKNKKMRNKPKRFY